MGKGFDGKGGSTSGVPAAFASGAFFSQGAPSKGSAKGKSSIPTGSAKGESSIPTGFAKGKNSKGGSAGKGHGPEGMALAKGWKRSREDFEAGGKGGQKGWLTQAEQKLAAGEVVYRGVVRSFDPERKNGFIFCEEIMKETGKEVYVFENVLQFARAGPGDSVAFFVHWSNKGLPQASHPMIRLKPALEGTFALKGLFKTVNSGHGFIECEETKQFFGRDVYVSKDISDKLEAGHLASFNVYLNRDGMPNASDAETFHDPTWEPTPSDLSVAQEVNASVFVKGKGKGSKGGKGGDSPGPMVPTSTGQTATGIVKSFNAGNNYGFIDSEEVRAQFGCDTFLHGKEFDGLTVGEAVKFEVGLGPKGQPQAINVLSLDSDAPKPKKRKLTHAQQQVSSQLHQESQGPVHPRAAPLQTRTFEAPGTHSSKWENQAVQKREAGEPVFTGIVKTFNPDKKFGFIDCKHAMAQLGCDVYVHESVLQASLAGPGDTVAFFLHMSQKGQPQASFPMIRLKTSNPSDFALKGTFKAAGSGGHGFIECPASKDFFGRDVYVNKDLAQELEVGQMVAFNAYLNAQGMPNADDAVPCEHEWEPTPANLGVESSVDTTPYHTKSWDKGQGKGSDGKGKIQGNGSDGKGKIQGKGSDGKGKIQPTRTGQTSTGKGSDGKGKIQPTRTGQTSTGFIKSFNEGNNYGFIDCEELKAMYDCDVFMHGREFSGKGLHVGQFVQFEVGMNPKGQPQAMNVAPLDDVAVAMLSGELETEVAGIMSG